MREKTCPGCGSCKPITEFNWKNKERGTRHTRCRGCTRVQVRSHYDRHREMYLDKARRRKEVVYREQCARIVSYLASHPCVDCGEADVVCLEFDHVRGVKRGDESAMIGDHSWPTIVAEIAKCEIRCANCHRRRTAKAKEWYRAN